MKHIGKQGDRKVVIVYRTVPGEEHMALIIYPDTLPRHFHDPIMKIVEGNEAQSTDNLADVLFRNLLPDGRPILQTLHKEGKIKKVPTNQIIVTPNAQSHVRLDELNTIIDGMKTGEEAVQKMAELDANAGLVDPLEKAKNNAVLKEAGDVLDDKALAKQMLEQSKQMATEAKSLSAESKRLEKEAFKLDPSLKPKRPRAKKKATATKK